MKEKFIIIETTYPNLAKAKNLAKILLTQKLAACVQFSSIKSMYFWEEKIANTNEILVSIKSKNSFYKLIEKTIKEHHEYEIPQILCIEVNQGSAPYLKWITSNLNRRK
jgi:periplasmic divalent cation tolerance protein